MARSSVTIASEAARRYAGALFDLVSEKNEISAIAADLKSFKAAAADSADLQRLLASPIFSREDKVQALTQIADKAGYAPTVKSFLGMMAQNGRTADLLNAIDYFDVLHAKSRGIQRAIARTAKPMSADQKNQLETLLASAVGGDVELATEVDSDLVGGLQLLIGSTLIDASIAAKLERMNTAMKGA